jgi:hypothetical protein
VIRVPGAKDVQAGAGTRDDASSASSTASASTGSSDLKRMDTNNMGIFEGTIPVPMQFPGRRYRETEEPWFYAQT